MTYDYDIAIIGAGLLGCFTARNLSEYSWRVGVFEKNTDVCTEVSRANTAIIYPGYDPVPGSLKARLSVAANENFENLCADLGVRTKRVGSIMVAYGSWGEKVLRKKYAQGVENGVKNIELLSGDGVMELEPNIRHGVKGGLYARSTYTVNPWELGIAAAETSLLSGVDIRLNSPVTAIEHTGGAYRIHSGGSTYTARAVVNCGGLHAAAVSAMVESPRFKLKYSAADYLVLDDSAGGFVNHVIMYEPEEKGKGATIVPTVGGNLMLGPSNIKIRSNHGFETTSDGIRFVKEGASFLFPEMPMDAVIRSFASIRPSISMLRTDSNGSVIETGAHVTDLCIFESDTHKGFINLAGIKTPGLTCCDEIGGYVTQMVIRSLGRPEPNPNYHSKRAVPPRLSDMSLPERSALAAGDDAYGNIVCRCKKITEGEVRDWIRRPLGATTVDGVKRRAGALLGRCQGGYCQQKILEILARELEISAESICKDARRSQLLAERPNEKENSVT